MLRFALLSARVGLCIFFLGCGSAFACKKVADDQALTITRSALSDLGQIGIDRSRIFEALVATSIPETSGCWGGATGNFDGQILSAGTLQWNYGQNSLQPVLLQYKAKVGNGLSELVQRHMPTYGKLVFSAGCLRMPHGKDEEVGITDDCQAAFAQLTNSRPMNPVFAREVDALFESLEMRQVQLDRFVKLIGSVKDDLARLFPRRTPSSRQIKWAIDTKVQQGGFPAQRDLERIRESIEKTTSEQQKRKYLLSLVEWYGGLCKSLDQGGIKHDCDYNVRVWPEEIASGRVTPEQFELLHLTFVKSRVAQGYGGYWQALTFQRRTKIILGVGSVAGNQN